MWFALGLVTLAGAAVASGYRRLHAGELAQSGNGFRYQVDRKSGALRRLRVSVPASPNASFECTRESGFDAFCKRWGLVRELQSGDVRFDRSVYVLTDDQVFRNALAGSLAKPLADLFLAAGNYRLERIVCRDSRLLADFTPNADKDDAHARQFAERVAVELNDIAQLVPKVMGARRFFDPLFFRSILILGASTGLAITGALQMARIAFTTTDWIYDVARLWMFAAVLGGALLLTLIVATIALLGRTARLHLVLVEVCLLGAFGAIATTFGELRDAVMEFDSSAPARVETTIVGKYVHRGRRSRTYYIELDDWHRPGKRIRLDVSASAYDRMIPMTRVSVVEHAGALGIRWIDGLRAE